MIEATYVRDLLREGLGVEDIALVIKAPVEEVRAMVRRWQKDGRIKAILFPKNEAADTRVAPRAGLTTTPNL